MSELQSADCFYEGQDAADVDFNSLLVVHIVFLFDSDFYLC